MVRRSGCFRDLRAPDGARLMMWATSVDAVVVSDTFAFQALPVPLYRRVHLRAVRSVVVAGLVVGLVCSFARWTIRSEQASFRAASRHAAAAEAAARGSHAGVGSQGIPTAGMAAISSSDLAAQDVARRALAKAKRIDHTRGSLAGAGPGQLARGESSVTFTDGPSIGPSIVSVAVSRDIWGAAVMSESGLCFAVALTGERAEEFGTLSSACTGTAALDVTAAHW